MVRKIVLGSMTFILLMSFVSAIYTEIKVKTMPNHEVQLTTFNPYTSSFEAYEKFRNISDQYGDLTFISKTDKVFNIILFIKKDNEKIMGPERYLEKYEPGKPIYLEVAPYGFEFIKTPEPEPEINETEENETEVVEEPIVEESEGENFISVTGSAIGNFFTNKLTYYILGGVVVLLVIVFVAVKLLRTNLRMPKDIRIKKLSELKTEKSKDRELMRAERELRDAREEIFRLKNQSKIDEIKKRIAEEQEEIRKLGG